MLRRLFSRKPKPDVEITITTRGGHGRTSKDAPGLTKDFGVTTPNCPHCGHEFEKMPARKRKCPGCKQSFLVRTRPADDKKILVTEPELRIVDEQWAIRNGHWHEFIEHRNRRDGVRDQLRVRFGGKEPSDGDVEWAILNEDSMAAATLGQWGKYADLGCQMGRRLFREKKYEDAIRQALISGYVQVNGPVDDYTMEGAKRPSSFAPGELGDLRASSAADLLDDCCAALSEDPRRYQEQFLTEADQMAKSGIFPLKPKKAWARFAKQLRST